MTKNHYECVSIGLSDVIISRIDMLCVDFALSSDRDYESPSTKTLYMGSTLYSSANGEYRYFRHSNHLIKPLISEY